jgi:hypothetical protein
LGTIVADSLAGCFFDVRARTTASFWEIKKEGESGRVRRRRKRGRDVKTAKTSEREPVLGFFDVNRRNARQKARRGVRKKSWKKFEKRACGFAFFGYNLSCCWGRKSFANGKP